MPTHLSLPEKTSRDGADVLVVTNTLGNSFRISSENFVTGLGSGGGGAITGEVRMFCGVSAPSGWLLCDGSEKSRTTYADLFAIIGEAFGVGDGNTTFNLPDFRGRSPLGIGQGAGLTNRSIGDSGGEEDHLLMESEMPSHSHSAYRYVGSGGYWNWPMSAGTASTAPTSSVGGGSPHNNMHPFLSINFIIYGGLI